MLIRPVTPADAAEILKIYSPYILNTPITFETEVPTLEEFTERIERIKSSYPYLVCEIDGKVIGYAYAAKHRERAAYQYSVEVSVYIDSDHHGKGFGKALYESLFEALKSYDYYTACACITLPNEKSVRLHKAFGFREIGTFHNVGYKAGKWLDVAWFEKPLKDYDTPSNENA